MRRSRARPAGTLDEVAAPMPYRDDIAALEIKLRALREARRELDVSIAETRRELRRHYGARRRSWGGVVIALVVLAVTGLASFFLVAPIFSPCCVPPEDTTYTAIQTIKGAAELYVARSDHCPTVEDLVDRGLLNGDQQATDAWDQPFRIECGAYRVYVSSAGADGVYDTSDDIASWRRPSRQP